MKIDFVIFDKIDISPFGHYKTYNYIPVHINYTVLFRGVVSINHKIVMKILTIIFQKIAILFSAAHLNCIYFWSWNVHIRRAANYDG
jgi:hypothetical protein